MRLQEILTEKELEKIETIKGEMPYKLSPFTISNKDMVFDRATGPLGCRTKDGFVKDKYRKKLDPTYGRDPDEKPDPNEPKVLTTLTRSR